jgi:hypothetical protein
MIEAAAWVSARPDSEYWSISVNTYKEKNDTIVIDYWCYSVEALNETRKSLGGKWDKEANDYSFDTTKRIGEYVTVKLSVPREEACKPKVIGQETVEVKDYANCPTKTITRDIVEYDCNPILG